MLYMAMIKMSSLLVLGTVGLAGNTEKLLLCVVVSWFELLLRALNDHQRIRMENLITVVFTFVEGRFGHHQQHNRQKIEMYQRLWQQVMSTCY